MSERAFSYVDERTDSMKKADLAKFMKDQEEKPPHYSPNINVLSYKAQTSPFQPPPKKARLIY